jgi:hypothetical protein
VGVAAYGLNGGARIADSTYLNYLIPFIATTDAKSTSVDLKLGKTLDLAGEHQITLGTYFTEYANKQNFQQSLLVSTMNDHPELVELRAIDAAGSCGPERHVGRRHAHGLQRLPRRHPGQGRGHLPAGPLGNAQPAPQAGHRRAPPDAAGQRHLQRA